MLKNDKTYFQNHAVFNITHESVKLSVLRQKGES